jgi:hypothetical protein
MNLIQYSDSLPADCRLRKDHKDAIFASDCYHLVAWRWALFGPKNEPHSAGKARERTQIADAQLQVRLWFCQYREDHRIKDAVAATLRPHFTLAMRSLLPIFRSKPRTFRTHLDWSKNPLRKMREYKGTTHVWGLTLPVSSVLTRVRTTSSWCATSCTFLGRLKTPHPKHTNRKKKPPYK